MAKVRRGGGARRARASSSSARAQRQVIPSSEELQRMLGSRPVAAESAEFYNPKRFKNLAGEAIGKLGEPDAQKIDLEDTYFYSEFMEYVDDQGRPISPALFRRTFDIDDETGELLVPGLKGPQEGESTAPAALSVIPTSTSEPERPRTVAAGYNEERQVLTVVFRDGTWYNYYEVTDSEWKDFKAAVSKGKFIYKLLDYKPRGYASMKGVAAGTRKSIYKYSRSAQIKFDGKQKGLK